MSESPTEKPAPFARPSLAGRGRPPVLSPRQRKVAATLLHLLCGGLCGALGAMLMVYPFDCFQLENSKEYRLYQQALQEYRAYGEAQGQRPAGLEYLSPELRELVDREGSCLVSRNEGKELVCLTYFPGWRGRHYGAADYLKKLFGTPHIVMAVIPAPNHQLLSDHLDTDEQPSPEQP